MVWQTSAVYRGGWSIVGLPGAALDLQDQLLVNYIGPGPSNFLTYLYPLPVTGNPITAPAPITITNNSTNGSPAVAFAGNGVCYFFWRGLAGDDHVYWAQLNIPQKTMPNGVLYPGGATQDGPVIVYSGKVNQRLLQGFIGAWRGSQAAQDERLYLTTIQNVDGNPLPTFTYPMNLSTANPQDFGQFSPSFAMAPEGAVFAAWTGVAGDTRVFWSVTIDPTQSAFASQVVVPGVTTGDRVSLVALTGPEGSQLVLVYRALDNVLQYIIGTYDAAFNVTWQDPLVIAETSDMSVPIGVFATTTNLNQPPAYYLVGDRSSDGEIDDVLTLLSYTP